MMMENSFFRDNPEGAVMIALDEREDGLLSGAVELRNGDELWLDYEIEYSANDESMVSIYRETEDIPVFEYRVRGRCVDVWTRPDKLLILWNRSRRVLIIDGEPLPSDEIYTGIPENVTPWLLRFASWPEK